MSEAKEGKKKTTDGAKLEDSNLANYGSKMHKDAKLAAAKTEKAWVGCGKEVGVEVWRIENFGVKKWPRKEYGTFFSGDSYICLNTYKPDPKTEKLAYNVHFWLGKETSQDEMGTAAYKTVELDDLLGDLPVQYREVQGYESKEFLGCFGGRIKLLDGGIDSAFNHVKAEEYKPRLLHFKGKTEKSVRISQVPLKLDSLNNGDVFVLDNGLQLFRWNGTKAGIFEKRMAMQVINGLKEDRPKAKETILDGTEADETFWGLLGHTEGKITVPKAIPDTKVAVQEKKLFQLSDSSGEMVMKEVASGKGNILKSKLVKDDVMILDVGHCVYVWIGQGASKKERSMGITYATDYLKKYNRPMHTPISRVVGGRETKVFHKEFDG